MQEELTGLDQDFLGNIKIVSSLFVSQLISSSIH